MESSFSEIFSFLCNNTLSRAELSNEGKIKNIHYGDVLIKFSDVIDVNNTNIPYVGNEITLKKKHDYLQTGDVVIADTAEDDTVGKTTEILNTDNIPVVSGLHTIPCRPKLPFVSSYLGYYLNSKSFHEQLYPFMQGIKVASISKTNIRKTQISYPSYIEQSKIAKLLNLISKRIEKQRQLVELVKSYKRGVIEAIFEQKMQVPFSEWKSVSFGSIIEEVSDRTQVENEDTLLSAAIEGMFLNAEIFDHQRGSSNIGYKKIRRGMLILSTQNLHLGNANVNLRFEHGIVSPAYKTYQITGCIPEFLNLWIKRDSTKQFFYNATTVGASVCRRNVEWQTLYEQTLLLPSEREQERIISLITPIQKILDAQISVALKLAELKQELLKELFI